MNPPLIALGILLLLIIFGESLPVILLCLFILSIFLVFAAIVAVFIVCVILLVRFILKTIDNDKHAN